MSLPEFPTTLSANSEILALRDSDGREISADDRAHLLQETRAGNAPAKLLVDAVTYQQPDEPNYNFIRFKPGILGKFAESFKGMPVLRDHERNDLSARAGTIKSSKLTHIKSVPAIKQTLELVKPWAIESALDGTLDRFSIGWHATGEVQCSACKEPMWGADCTHYPGQKLKSDDEDEEDKYVQMVFTGAVGREVSATNDPAVNGTGIDSIREALSKLRANHAPVATETLRRNPKMTKEITDALGIAEAADEAAVLAAIKQAKTLLAAEKEAHRITATTLEEAHAALKSQADAQAKAEVDALVKQMKDEGRIKPQRDLANVEIESEVEKAIRSIAQSGGIAAARETASAFPKVVPIGASMQSVRAVDGASQVGAASPVGFTPEQLAQWKAMGVTPEDVLKHGGVAPSAR